jgi:hypothetical protein
VACDATPLPSRPTDQVPAPPALAPDARAEAVGCAGEDPAVAGTATRDEPAVIDTATWDDLGLDGPGDLVVEELFVSSDGRSWERAAESPFGGRFLAELTATPLGFFAVTDGDGGPELLRSTDGVQWQAVTPPVEGPDGQLMSLGVVGDRLVAVPATGVAGLTSDDGGQTWSRTELSTVVDVAGADHVGVVSADNGPLGVALIVVAYHGETSTYTLLTSPDAGAWSAQPLTDVVGDEGPGSIAWLVVGADTVAFTGLWPVDDGTGATAARTFVGAPSR